MFKPDGVHSGNSEGHHIEERNRIEKEVYNNEEKKKKKKEEKKNNNE